LNGILIIDKPEGLTSAEVVRRVKRRAGGKVGHLGTLDPFATGVLPLCLGSATKIAQFLNTADKSYEGLMRLGAGTDTGDRTGALVRSAPVPHLRAEQLRELEQRFTGEYSQVPPMYSALKREGVPLYKLARQGIEVPREKRLVRIHALRLERFDDERLHFRLSCSKGTYVRVLAEDIASACESVAHLEALRRTQFGGFCLDQAASLADLEAGRNSLISIRDALAHLPAVRVDRAAVAAVCQGQARMLSGLGLPARGRLATLLGPTGDVLAVVVRRRGGWQFGRVLRAGELYNAASLC